MTRRTFCGVGRLGYDLYSGQQRGFLSLASREFGIGTLLPFYFTSIGEMGAF